MKPIKYVHPENESVSYKVNGRLHRLDGPALIEHDGRRIGWYRNGVRHRIDGPALIMGDKEFYFINGKEYTYKNWLMRIKLKDYIKLL